MNTEIKININTLPNDMHITFLKNSKYIHNFNATKFIPNNSNYKDDTKKKLITLFFKSVREEKLHTAVKAQIIHDTLPIIHHHT
jgi:hypothetical protein